MVIRTGDSLAAAAATQLSAHSPINSIGGQQQATTFGRALGAGVATGGAHAAAAPTGHTVALVLVENILLLLGLCLQVDLAALVVLAVLPPPSPNGFVLMVVVPPISLSLSLR